MRNRYRTAPVPDWDPQVRWGSPSETLQAEEGIALPGARSGVEEDWRDHGRWDELPRCWAQAVRR